MMRMIPPAVLAAVRKREVILSAIVAAVASAVLLAYRAMNPDGGAELYYEAHASEGSHQRAAHRLMQICYVVVISAAAFNLRFVAAAVARPCFDAAIGRWRRARVV